MIIVAYVSNARNWLAVSSSLIWAGIRRLMPQNSKNIIVHTIDKYDLKAI